MKKKKALGWGMLVLLIPVISLILWLTDSHRTGYWYTPILLGLATDVAAIVLIAFLYLIMILISDD